MVQCDPSHLQMMDISILIQGFQFKCIISRPASDKSHNVIY